MKRGMNLKDFYIQPAQILDTFYHRRYVSDSHYRYQHRHLVKLMQVTLY